MSNTPEPEKLEMEVELDADVTVASAEARPPEACPEDVFNDELIIAERYQILSKLGSGTCARTECCSSRYQTKQYHSQIQRKRR